MSGAVWPGGAKCAVSFAYIGGLPEHIDLAPGLLKQLGIRASFYVDPTEVLTSANLWTQVIGSEHEFGVAPFESSDPSGYLENWDTIAVREEIISSKRFVQEFFGKPAAGVAHRGETLRSAKNDCTVLLHNSFDHVLTGSGRLNTIDSLPHRLSSVSIKRYPSSQLTDAMTSTELNWIIIPFRRIFVNTETLLVHRMILEAVNRQRSHLYLAPVSEVANSLKTLQSSVD
jgi:hypothetical protein